MKGIIFDVFEKFVQANWGADFFEEVLEATELETQEPFVGPGTYPDADLFALVSTAIERLGVSLDDALQLFGHFAFAHLAQTLPGGVSAYEHPADLLAAVDSIIHVEVRKLYPDAQTPKVEVSDRDGDSLVLSYESRRQLCPLLLGLLEGAAEHFGFAVEHEPLHCMRDGASECAFQVRFDEVPAQVDGYEHTAKTLRSS